MTLLAQHGWKLKYTPEDGNLVKLFYVPALEDAVRYHRLTGYFTAGALALAARGIEGLVRHSGQMRLLVGCTLDPPEIDAIERGAKLRQQVEAHLASTRLVAPDQARHDALELLAWMVERGFLEVKVAIPCDAARKPIFDGTIFHEKSAIIEDRVGDRIAWTGSLNETAGGWVGNWESVTVFRSWTGDRERVDIEEENFARLWADKSTRVLTLDVPTAVRDDLLQYLPKDDALPARLKPDIAVLGTGPAVLRPVPEPAPAAPDPTQPAPLDIRRLIWGYIAHAAALPDGGERVGETTCSIAPWPHQIRAFERLYNNWPPRLLIADEVGLGKTIQAGLLLRQAWLAGRAKRILVLAPKAVLKQWQLELREKFNLNWPIYDGQKLVWQASSASDRLERQVEPGKWHHEPVVITSSQLMRRRPRAEELLERAEGWDLVILDEAHHARRRGAGSAAESGPNALLKLMQGLKAKAKGLVLVTATPMQVHPVEVWDLLSLLGLPPEWTEAAFVQFFEDLEQPNPSHEVLARLARLFRAVEGRYGEVSPTRAVEICQISPFKAKSLLRALRSDSTIPLRQLSTLERQALRTLLVTQTPVRRLVSRNTRELLREYFRRGLLTTRIAEREVSDRFLDMTAEERRLYEAVEDYIATTYNQASQNERSAVGFVMTVYRRRLASSFRALAETLQAHLDAVRGFGTDGLAARAEEDTADDLSDEDTLDTDDVEALQREALAQEERTDIESLLSRIRQLPPDSKLVALRGVLTELRATGYAQVMVFTQYTDTMDFLRDELAKTGELRLLCFSGRGGEVPQRDGSWRVIGRDEAKRLFREGQADVLLCTDAASEGLNFQFCGALVNYDMPWSPMRVEQRIGRIDRLGQKHTTIRIVNLHYEGTVETDVYRALRGRISLFEQVVGRLQPILARLPRAISEAVLNRADRSPGARAALVQDLEGQVREAEGKSFDIDAVTADDFKMPVRPESRLTLRDLDRILNSPEVLPPGITVRSLGTRQYAYSAPGMPAEVRVTTDAGFYEDHTESLELWSPGSPIFPLPEIATAPQDLPPDASVPALLQMLHDKSTRNA